MVVYKITNKINNKVYIGITQQRNGFKDRYSSRGEGIERVYNYHLQCKNKGRYYNIHLLGAIEQYGFENFEVEEEFDTAENIEELKEKEIYWINYYNSNNPKYGYNNTNGGDGIDKGIITKVKSKRRIANDYGIKNIGYCGKDKKKKKEIIKQLCKNNKSSGVYICRMCGKLYIEKYGDIKKGFCEECLEYEDYYDEVIDILGELPQIEEYEKKYYKIKRRNRGIPFVATFKITEDYCNNKNNIKIPLSVQKARWTREDKIFEKEQEILDIESKISNEEEKELFRKSAGIIDISDLFDNNPENLGVEEYIKKTIKEYGKYYDYFVNKYGEKENDELNI